MRSVLRSMLKLRDYQERGVEEIRQAYRQSKKAPLYVLPTGGGKTVVFTYIAASVTSKGKRALVLVHRQELLRQTSAKLNDFSVNHGLIQAGFTPSRFAHVQVASVQTLKNRLDKYGAPPDLIVIDEAHHALASTWQTIISAFPQARILGVTATPIHNGGVGLGLECGGIFDHLVLGPSITELIRDGYLVKPVVYAPTERLDLSSVHTRHGDYIKAELDVVVDKPTITGNAVEHYARLCPGEPAVVFCVSVNHARHVAEQFNAAGFRSAFADGKMKDDDRKRTLNGLSDGSVQVLTTCDLISEGTDIPAIACAILLRPTQSTGLYIQQVGRALRPAPGKSRALILDHVGNVITHGMPDEDREWTLDGNRKRKKNKDEQKPASVTQCPQCFAMHSPAPLCPICNYVYPKPEGNTIEETDGELKELTKDQILLIKKQRAQEVHKARTVADLKQIEKERGYKPGWANYIIQSRRQKGEIII